MSAALRRLLERVRGTLQSPVVLLVSLAVSSCVSGPIGGIGESPAVSQELPASTRQLIVSVIDERGTPLEGAVVSFTDAGGTHVAVSDPEGLAAFDWIQGPVTVVADAPGLLPGEAVVVERPDDPFSLALHPVVLRGTVTDEGGYPLAGALVTLGASQTTSGPDGGFELLRAAPGEVIAHRPARAATRAEWSGEGPLELVMRPRIIKALHVSGAAAADVPALSELVGIAEATVVNGLVIDLKDETGRIYYDSNIETATRAGAVMNWFSLSEVLSEAALHDLYVIGRIVAFMDPIAPEAYPSMAVWDQRRDAPFQLNGQHYLDPSDEGARGYALDLAVEACRAGVDEIQFDQLAYPVGIDRETLFDGGATEEDRVGAVRTFLAEASTRLGREGCALAADVFGFTTSINHDGGIGQNFRQLSEVTDVLSPTLYPSSYSEGWFGLDDPSSRPGRVVGLALDDGLERIAGPAVLRPWLQDFSYGVDSVRAQIAAAEERGLGWMLWNVQSQFTTGALDAARDEGTGGPG